MTQTFKNLKSPKAGEREATNHNHWWAVRMATHWVKTPAVFGGRQPDLAHLARLDGSDL